MGHAKSLICLLSYLNHRDVCVSPSLVYLQVWMFALCGYASLVVWKWGFDFSQSWVIHTHYMSEAHTLATFMFVLDEHFDYSVVLFSSIAVK